MTEQDKKIQGNTCMQSFVSDKGCVFVAPTREGTEAPKASRLFAKEVGVLIYLIADPVQAQKSQEVVAFCHKIGTILRILEESSQWADRAELYTRLLKEGGRREICENHSPIVLWDYTAELKAQMFNVTANNLFPITRT